MLPYFIKLILNNRRQRIVANKAIGNVLDIGWAQFPNKYLVNAVGFDINSNILPNNYTSTVQADMKYGLGFKERTFQTVIAAEFFEHIDFPEYFFKEVHRVLDYPGRLVMTVPNFKCKLVNHRACREHINFMDEKQIIKMAEKNGFKLETLIPIRRFYIEDPSWWLMLILRKKPIKEV